MPAFRRGVRAMIPLSVGSLAWGITFGVVADQASWSPLAATTMSLVVFSGSAQIVAMDMLADGIGLVAILGVTLLISLRYILMGMTMSGWFRTTPRRVFWPGIHYLSDQSWAMTVQQMRSGFRDAGYFSGLNAGMAVAWVTGTLLGASIGGLLGGHVDGLHFASTAALVGILAGIEVRRKDILPWIATGAAAVIASEVLGGSWFVFIGIAAGLAVTLMTGGKHADR